MKEFRVELAMKMIGSYNSHQYKGWPHQNERRGGARRMKVPHYPQNAQEEDALKSARGPQPHGGVKRLCHTGGAATDCFLKHHLSKGLYNQ